MLLSSLFKNQTLDDLILGNSEFNFVLHKKLSSCYFLHGLTFIQDFMRTFSLEEKDAINSSFLLIFSLQIFFEGVFRQSRSIKFEKRLSSLGPTIVNQI